VKDRGNQVGGRAERSCGPMVLWFFLKNIWPKTAPNLALI
jgi:hypothetical protein